MSVPKKLLQNKLTDRPKLMHSGLRDPVNLAQDGMMNFGKSKKKRTCSNRLEKGNPSSARREDNRFETLRLDEDTAPWEEVEMNKRGIDAGGSFLIVKSISGAAKSAWPLRRSGVETLMSKKLERLEACHLRGGRREFWSLSEEAGRAGEVLGCGC